LNEPLEGFLLTRDWRDGNQGIDLTYWVSSTQGPVKLTFSGARAVCFISREQDYSPSPGHRRKVDLLGPDNQPVDALYFTQQRQLQRLVSPAAVPRKNLFETDIKPTDRFLMERFITGPVQIEGKSNNTGKFLHFHNPRLKPAQYKPDLKVVSIDIETNYETEQLLSIAGQGAGVERAFLLHPESIEEDWITCCKDEKALLLAFITWVEQVDPDILIGWNVINFDFSVLERRCKVWGIKLSIGRENSPMTILPSGNASSITITRLAGRVVMDGIESLRAAFYNFENFSLESVAHELLGRGKLIKGDKHRGEEILDLFHADPVALARYNLEDCRLVSEIFEHTRLIDFTIERAAATGLTLGRVGGSVAAFDFLYLPQLHRNGYVAGDPPLDDAGGLSSPGGYVLDSRPGLYDDVLVLDFKSLYPSIIRTFLIDPMALWQPGEDRVEGFQGASFSRLQPILPKILEHLWAKRDIAKVEKNSALSQAVKIIMNSFYGVLGTSACRFYDTRLTSSITRRGHEIIQRSKELIEAEGLEVIYGDTDSLFVWLANKPNEADAQIIGERLANLLNQWWQETLIAEYKVESRLEVEFETHYLKFLMPTIRGSGAGSKKRYAGMIRKPDQSHELIFKGLETVRTDWTPLAREFQQELFRRVFEGLPYLDYVMQIHTGLYDGKLDQQLIFRKQLRQPLEKYVRNIPPHAQAAKKMRAPGRWIEYLICKSGPEPIEKPNLQPDYDHYAERQLKPVADTVLAFLDTGYDEIVGGQVHMFR
jgi:DNA polymerase-2